MKHVAVMLTLHMLTGLIVVTMLKAFNIITYPDFSIKTLNKVCMCVCVCEREREREREREERETERARERERERRKRERESYYICQSLCSHTHTHTRTHTHTHIHTYTHTHTQIWPMSLMFVLNVFIGLNAFRLVNIPMFT